MLERGNERRVKLAALGTESGAFLPCLSREAIMSVRQMFLTVVILATAICVLAQTTETKTPQPQPKSSAIPAENQGGSGAKALQQVEILTDTMGVDFGPYLTQIVKIVKQNWYNLMPPSVFPPIKKQGKVSIEFSVLKDGRVSGMTLNNKPDFSGLNITPLPSKDVDLDRAAWASITASTPFPPLPPKFPGERLGLRFFFYYNVSPDTSQITISPSMDVRVPTGSTLSFVASGKDITGTSVTWSVSGPGCSKSACGTISDSGLYTAPMEIPDPPMVIVEVTSKTDMSIAKSKVTIVRANPPH
jgi:hypothetical protein